MEEKLREYAKLLIELGVNVQPRPDTRHRQPR